MCHCLLENWNCFLLLVDVFLRGFVFHLKSLLTEVETFSLNVWVTVISKYSHYQTVLDYYLQPLELPQLALVKMSLQLLNVGFDC